MSIQTSPALLSRQLLHMTVRETKKQNIIAQAVENRITEKVAAAALNLGVRQIQRLKRTFREK